MSEKTKSETAAGETIVETRAAPVRKRKRARLETPSLAPIVSGGEGTLEERVYKSLRESMMAGVFPPDTHVSSRSLADALSVSAMPVREALKRLEGDGVLESQEKRGFLVRRLSRNEFEEVLEIRLMLEGAAAFEAAGKITSAKVSRLESIVNRYKKAKDQHARYVSNAQFHLELYRCAGMPILFAIIENIWLLLGPTQRHIFALADATSISKHHDEILDALRKNDAKRVRRALKRDLIAGAKVLKL